MATTLRMLSLVCVIATSVGCASIAEGDRQLVDQTLKASVMVINGVIIGPETVQAMLDIKKNAEVLQANLGAPKDPKPYSPQASEEARKKATEQHQNPWWNTLLSGLAGVVLSGSAARFLMPFFPSFFAGNVGKTMTTLIEGIASVRRKADQSPDKKLSIDDIMTQLVFHQDKDGIREFVKNQADIAEGRMNLELPKVTLGLPRIIPPT